MKPLHVCAEPGCPELCQGAYCEKHAKPSKVRAPDTRASANARGYDYQWRKVRAGFLKAHPWCMADGCGELASEVDHIVPLAQWGTSEWANLQALCKHHHSRKTASEER